MNADEIRGTKREQVVFDTQKTHTLDFNNVALIEKLKADTVALVRKRDPIAIKLYKQIAEHRINVWMDTDNITESARAKIILRMLEDKFPNRKDIKILDLGAWSGTVAQFVADNGWTNITWVQADVEEMPTAPFGETYDAIFAFEMLEHLVDPFSLLQKARGWLNDNGAIFFTIPTEEYVFGYKGDEVASEHISKITKEELKGLGAVVNTLTATINNKADFEWYTGYIPKTQYVSATTPPKMGPMKNVSVLIAVPTARYVESATFKSIYELEVPEGVTTHLEFFYGYNIAQIRNLIANFASLNHFDYVFNVDSDIVLPPNALADLLAQKQDIIGGAYLQRIVGKRNLEAYRFIKNGEIERLPESALNTQGLIELSSIGFGCTLVSTKCFEAVGYPQFVYDNSIDFSKPSEDTFFCHKAKEKGYKTYVLPSLRCGHIGQLEHRI
jgi:2-polyprenyl-3-methyl-5-hydroxy-6-metoxy-1,4-benzoquinol methylase